MESFMIYFISTYGGFDSFYRISPKSRVEIKGAMRSRVLCEMRMPSTGALDLQPFCQVHG